MNMKSPFSALSPFPAWRKSTRGAKSRLVGHWPSLSGFCGTEDRGFYPDCDSLTQSNPVLRLLMHGIDTPGRADFSWGPVCGIRHSQANPGTYELGHAPVGVSPGFTPDYPHHE
jgi:hypothetical protein